MAIKNLLFVSGNYIISEKTNGDEPVIRSEFAVGYSVYTRGINAQFPGGVDQFQIIQGGISSSANGRLIIPVTELDNETGVWYDQKGIEPYTVETLSTFLRQNTGVAAPTASGPRIENEPIFGDGTAKG